MASVILCNGKDICVGVNLHATRIGWNGYWLSCHSQDSTVFLIDNNMQFCVIYIEPKNI